jgi:hypothetical protein
MAGEGQFPRGVKSKSETVVQCVLTIVKKKERLKKLIVRAINLTFYITSHSYVGQRREKRERPPVFSSRELLMAQPKQFRFDNDSGVLAGRQRPRGWAVGG